MYQRARQSIEFIAVKVKQRISVCGQESESSNLALPLSRLGRRCQLQARDRWRTASPCRRRGRRPPPESVVTLDRGPAPLLSQLSMGG